MQQPFLDTLRLIKSDLQMRCDYEHKKLTLLRIIRFHLYSASASIIMYRWQTFFYSHHLKPIAGLIGFLNSILFVVRIDPTAQIGSRFILLHASCITIGPNVVIGKNCVLAHQNTICLSPFYQANMPRGKTLVIGDNLFMGTGSIITGAITIGSHVKVSMNALVNKSYPDDAVLFGVPAKNLAQSESQSI